MKYEELTLYILKTFNNGNEVKTNTEYKDSEIAQCIRFLTKNNCVISCYQDVLGNYCADGLTPLGQELLNRLRAT